jgi:ribosomal protein S18 acetylase RimI-like enzyme
MQVRRNVRGGWYPGRRGAAGRWEIGKVGTMTARPKPIDDPAAVLAVFDEHREVHPYGIYDVVNLWDCSRWWLRERAVVGLIALPGSDVPVVYAVSATAGEQTLQLLADLAPDLPPHIIITGPDGLTNRLAGTYRASWSGPHIKMHLAHPAMLPPADPHAYVLEAADLPRIEHLFAADPHTGVYFHPGLLDSGYYIGIDHATQLVAVAGVHLVDRHCGVAAVGNVSTHPGHRRRGLARRVMATLCHRLIGEVDLVGLNVRRDNRAAHALYEGMGFASLTGYEEAELTTSRPAKRVQEPRRSLGP